MLKNNQFHWLQRSAAISHQEPWAADLWPKRNWPRPDASGRKNGKKSAQQTNPLVGFYRDIIEIRIISKLSITLNSAEAPEEEYDSRSLFERLQEQKQKKDLEYEEAHKLSKAIEHQPWMVR